MPSLTPRNAMLALLALTSLYLMPWHIGLPFPYADTTGADPGFPLMIAETLGSYGETDAHTAAAAHPHWYYASRPQSASFSPAETYFSQAFSPDVPRPYGFPALGRQCARTAWKNETAVYLQCEGIYLGLTSVISQVKSCFKMAIEAGVGVVLPDIPLRDESNLVSYNQGNKAAERPFGAWFDVQHLVDSMKRVCPGLSIITQKELEALQLEDENKWSIDIHSARYFRERDGYFWAGKPFKVFFDERLSQLREEHKTDREGDKPTVQGELHRRSSEPDPPAAIVVGMRADFELFNVANDPTGHDRHVWDDLGKALRFLPEPRTIVDRLLRQIDCDHFFAVHFRGEGDNMWASPEEQMVVDLDALDKAWEMHRHRPEIKAIHKGEKPPVYLAGGSEASMGAFVEAGKSRGWNVTSKYQLAKAMATNDTMDMIELLPFDFQAIIDFGMIVKSYFLIGLMGSAFTYTAANLRDPTTRYRGSSFEVQDDGGARTHMFPNNDIYGDTTMEKYACCL